MSKCRRGVIAARFGTLMRGVVWVKCGCSERAIVVWVQRKVEKDSCIDQLFMSQNYAPFSQ